MNDFEKKMIDILIDLKENYFVKGVKAEFEAEGTRFEEALRLKDIVSQAGLDLTIKIGGCEAIKDMFDARSIGVNSIVAPMIESEYAMKKFVNAVKFVFPESERNDIKFFINIETITGFNNIDKIISSPEFAYLSGIVFGRVDMTASMGLTRDDINTPEIFDMANVISNKMLELNKNFVIGGSVSAASVPFFKKLPFLSAFETRKIIFDADKALLASNTDKGILKALEFELMWLKNKRYFYNLISDEDNKRIQMLELIYNN